MDRTTYDAGSVKPTIRYLITVMDPHRRPIPNWPVSWSILEEATGRESVGQTVTDGRGQVAGTYAVQHAGTVLVSAASPVDVENTPRKVGAEIRVTAR